MFLKVKNCSLPIWEGKKKKVEVAEGVAGSAAIKVCSGFQLPRKTEKKEEKYTTGRKSSSCSQRWASLVTLYHRRTDTVITIKSLWQTYTCALLFWALLLAILSSLAHSSSMKEIILTSQITLYNITTTEQETGRE